MSKVLINCDFCGKQIMRYPSQMKAHNFCSRGCLAAFSSKNQNPEGYAKLKDYTNISQHMSQMNRELNPTRMTPEVRAKLRAYRLGRSFAFVARKHRPMKQGGLRKPPIMTPEVREKLRNARLNTGKGVTYRKYYGRHEHRVIAEQMLGRPLRKGEVVHHIDGDKRNNTPENLMVFASQAEHVRWHKKAGDLK